jgi:hypothetical protein
MYIAIISVMTSPLKRLKMDYNKYSFVLRSKNRTRIVLALIIENTISRLAKITENHLSHISRTLRELEKSKITMCLTKKAPIGRLYTLTKEGMEIRKRLVKAKVRW